MKTVPKILISIFALWGIAYGGAKLSTQMRTESTDTFTPTAEQAKKGEYVARTADCFACHTTPNGQAMAGGLAMQTPLGAIYSTNITPDPETGIGNYTYADFKNAVKHGIRPDGSPLYPAMPYPSYAIMPEEDLQALYAYFMKDVTPVSQANQPSTIPPILNWRWPVAYWQMLFAPKRQFIPASTNATLNRGQYLVEGPGHCGACHTPRGIAYQEKTLTNSSSDFLSGAVIDGWRAKSLRGEARGLGEWSEQELSEFFSRGRTAKTAAFGAMSDVVQHSTQYFTKEDNTALVSYLKTLSPTPGKALKLPEKADTTTNILLNGELKAPGAVLYNAYCMTCHRADGNGMPYIFPALNKNSAVLAKSPQSVIQVILEGSKMPSTPQDTMAFTMPGFSFLSNQEIADITNFARNGWTNQAPEVSAKDVETIRRFLEKKAPNVNAQGDKHE